MKRILLLILVTGLVARANAQGGHPPFWSEIQSFKKEDSAGFPGKHKILFTGSSSFRLWSDVQSYFPNHPIINRGFGGSTLLDMIRYQEDLILPYEAKQIVIYCGENDLASSDTVTAEMVVERFRTLFNWIRRQQPHVPIVYIAIKPSPSRERLMPKMLVANLGIRQFLKKKKKTVFVDVYHAMLTPEGKPLTDIFREDRLHMNAKGYAIWQKLIEPYLL